MRKLHTLITVIALMLATEKIKAQWPPTDPAWTLSFGDEFNDTTGYKGNNIDTSKWSVYPSWIIDSNKQYLRAPVNAYVDVPGYDYNYPRDTSNVHVVNGTCRLIARKGTYSSVRMSARTGWARVPTTFAYSNGSLASKRMMRFGYYEIKFRVPTIGPPATYNAYQPTFWLYSGYLGTGIDHSEIDVYEIAGNATTNNDFTNGGYYKTAQYPDTIPPLASWHKDSVSLLSTGTWHTAAVNWTRDKMDFYLDGNFLRTNTTYADSLAEMSMYIEAYLPLFLNLNVAINAASTVFPYVYEIDYVHVYQIKEACSTDTTYLTATASNFNNKLYRNLTIGGTGATNYFNNGTNSALGTTSVLLDVGTTIDNNTTMYIDVIPCNPNKSYYNPIYPTMPPPSNDYNFRQSRH